MLQMDGEMEKCGTWEGLCDMTQKEQTRQKGVAEHT